MKQFLGPLAAVVACAALTLPDFAAAQTGPAIPPSLTTPDKVETRIGTLEFKDGAPSKATLDKVYDNLDFTYAFRAFTDTLQGVSIHALRKGMQSIGMKDNEVHRLLRVNGCQVAVPDGQCRHDLRHGLLRSHKRSRGDGDAAQVSRCCADAWFRWVIDLGVPGPDRGEGGKYLILPPDYSGPLPEGGYFVAHARTNTIVWFGRSFLENHKDPKPVVETIRKLTKVYPYEIGGVGTPVAEFLAGKAKLGARYTAAADRLPRGQRQGDEHHPAERLDLLRDAQRGRAKGTGHLARCRS